MGQGDLLDQMEQGFQNPDTQVNEDEEVGEAEGELDTVLVSHILNQHQFDDAHALDLHLLTKVSKHELKDLREMDYIDDIAPLLLEMEEQLQERGILEEDEDSRGFNLTLTYPIKVASVNIKTVKLARPTIKNLSAPGSRQKGEVRRNVQLIKQLSGLTTRVIHNMAVIDYLTLVERFQVWREGR